MTATPSPRHHRLPRRKILRGRDPFRLLKSQGSRKAGKLLVCNYLEIAGRDQVAFIISKRCGNAVTRNRLRRRMKEAFRHFQHDLCPDRVIVWIARAPAGKASFAELDTEMREMIAKSNLWREKEGF